MFDANAAKEFIGCSHSSETVECRAKNVFRRKLLTNKEQETSWSSSSVTIRDIKRRATVATGLFIVVCMTTEDTKIRLL